MTVLTNLLPYIPGASGFGSYVRRVLPGIPGPRLLIDPEHNICECSLADELPDAPPRSRRLKLLQRLSLTQHGLNVRQAIEQAIICGVMAEWPSVVYSPYCDTLLQLPELRQIITCHDLTPLHISNSRKATWRYRLWTPVHIRRAHRVIAISRFVADQLIQTGLRSEQIEIILNGIEVERPGVESPRSEDIIVLARHDRNKNVAAAIDALEHLQANPSGWRGKIIVIGKRGRQTEDLLRRQQQLDRPDQLVFVEHLSQAELITSLRNSWALASFSRMEGFDYPVLEAKAEGIPTIVSDIPVHRELHSDSSMLFQLDDGGVSFAAAIEQLYREPRLWQDLSRAGRSLAVKLSLEQQQNLIREAIDTCRLS